MTDYKKQADERERMLESAEAAFAGRTPRAPMPPDLQIRAIQSLVLTLETGLKIAANFIVTGKEPYPSAALTVVQQSRAAIDLARAAGIVPERPAK